METMNPMKWIEASEPESLERTHLPASGGDDWKEVRDPEPIEPSSVETVEKERAESSAPDSALEVHQENLSHVLMIEDLLRIRSPKAFIDSLRAREIDTQKVERLLLYEIELEKRQIELVRMQRWVQSRRQRVAILFEGRDAAGKGGAIRRFTEHLNPRAMRVVALPKPTEEEQGQWYFQRYMRQLPNPGEIVFFDRSWYNRAVVEPVNAFCTREQYDRFMRQVPEFEHMLYEDGVQVVKFWFSISKSEQLRRFESRAHNPLKQWKLSPIDAKAQELWDSYTHYKELMLSQTHTSFSPWIIVKANNKRKARLESIRYILSLFAYEGRETSAVSLHPDPNIIARYHRAASKLD